MNSRQAFEIATQLAGVTTKDHFGLEGLWANKRMFMTIAHDKNTGMFRFAREAQQEFLAQDGEAFSSLDNKWGEQGWTRIQFEFVERELFHQALKSAYEFSAVKGPAPKKKARMAPIKKKTRKGAKKK